MMDEASVKSPLGRVSATRHQLPQIPIPRARNPRMAVSKTSRHSDGADKINIIPSEAIEKSPPAAPVKSPTVKSPTVKSPPVKSPKSPLGKSPPATSRQRRSSKKESPSLMAPPGLPTPPTSEAAYPTTPATTKAKSSSTSPPTPIKLRFSKSGTGKGEVKCEVPEVTSPEVQPDIESPTSPTGTTRRTKTKGHIKKQLMKKKGQKTEPAESEIVIKPPPPEPETKAVVKDEPTPEMPATPVTPVVTSPGVPVTGTPVGTTTPGGSVAVPQCLLGDLFLGRVPGHPYWPCMVAYHPFEGQYMRAIRNSREYHVQFFGNEGHRGWMNFKRLIPFTGREDFDAWCVVMRKKDKKNAKIYTVGERRIKAWEVAVKEATQALAMSIQERKQTYTFVYQKPDEIPHSPSAPAAKKNKQNKRKLDESLSKTPSTTTPPRKKQKVAHAGSGSEADLSPSHIILPEGLSDQNATQYMVFCQKRRDLLHREHPGYTQLQISDELSRQWAQLDDEQRSKFIPMGSDVKNLSLMMSSMSGKKTRAIKPTKKKLEADHGSDLYVKKKAKTATPQRPPKTELLPSPMILFNMDVTINDVARGAGNIPEMVDEDLMTEWPTNSPDNDAKKSRKADGSADFPEVETSSHGSSVKEEPSVPKWRPPKLPGDNGDNDYELEIFKMCISNRTQKEKICQICEEAGELIECEGPCNGTYHLSCLGLTVSPVGSFRCDECGSGRHTCFVCKESSNTTRRCSVANCGRFYHDDCVLKYPLARMEKNNLICPLHTCSTCAAENPKSSKISKGRMYRCVRCPTSYHATDFCIAAGSQNLAGLHIVCSRHFQPKKNTAHHSHINTNWCFLCGGGGTLLCCESCPAAFHCDCLKIQSPEEQKWYCPECSRGKRPLYGEIVWVKFGNYRWWPGEICQPKHVPMNIQQMAHQVGEFPMRFFGSHDYYWTHQARIFLFQEGDKGSKEKALSNNLAQIFNRAVSEATMAYKIWCMAKSKRAIHEQERNDKKPAPYKFIKVNYPIGKVQIPKLDPSQLPRCECKPSHPQPCGVDSECLNRMMMYECHPLTCPAGEACLNQLFTKRHYPNSEARKASERGWGLFTNVQIKKGTFVNEYVGDLIDEEEVKRRVKFAHDNDITNFYMLTLDNKRVIDAGPKGNWSRFMNHSCQPNCETQKWNVNGDVRVGLFTTQDVAPGSELTFNYNLECLGNEKTVCQCGAANCSGFLGVRPKVVTAEKEKQRDKKRRKKKKVPTATLH